MTQPNADAAVKAPGPPLWSEGLPAMLVLDFDAIEMTDGQRISPLPGG